MPSISQILPYVYAISGSVMFVFMQIFFKMLTAVIPQSFILASQSFVLLLFNSYLLVSNQKYQQTFKYYDKLAQSEGGIIEQRSQVQDENRFQIHIKDPAVFRLIMKRQFISSLGIVVLGTALQHVPMSITNSLFNTGPILVFFVEAYFYKKPLSKVHLLLTIVAFTGVLIVVNPFKALMHEDTSEMLYMLLPLLSAVLASVGFIYLHDLKGKINQLIMIEYAYICQVLYFNFLSNFSEEGMLGLENHNHKFKYFEPSIWDPYCVGAYILMILFAYTSLLFRVKSLFLLKPSKIVPFNYTGIILSLIIDMTVFGHQTNFFEILGILLTSVGLLSHLALELTEKKQKDDLK